jgi:hypothetical protein
MGGWCSGWKRTVGQTPYSGRSQNRSGFQLCQLPSGGVFVFVHPPSWSPKGHWDAAISGFPPRPTCTKLRRAWSLLLIGWLGLAIAHAEAQLATDFLAGRVKMEGGVFTLYSGTEQEAAILVRLDKAYTDYQRKGFFRIGALPISVMEGVTFEIEHPVALTKSLEELHRWLGPQGSARLEMRRLTFIVPSPTPNRLTAGRARLAGQGILELLDGVTFHSGTTQISAARGTLQIKGQTAGQLILEGKQRSTNSLLAHIPTANPINQQGIK